MINVNQGIWIYLTPILQGLIWKIIMMTNAMKILDFQKHMSELRERLNIPEEILCYNNAPVDGVEALCTFLKRFSCTCRYVDMVPIFARPIP